MKTANLLSELEAAAFAVRNAHLDRLQALGVTSQTIAKLGEIQPPFGVIKVDYLGGGLFQPGGDVPHIVQPIYDAGILIDLVAWRTSDPRSWLWRTGAAWALNPDEIKANSWTQEPLTLHATPLDWLRASAQGLCILNWEAHEIRQLLRVKAIDAESHIARQLRGALMKPAYFPEITAKEGLRYAA